MDKNVDWQVAVQKLKELSIPNRECPVCHHNKFTLETNVACILLSKELGKIEIGNHIPSAVVVCNKCGHLDFFALAALGLVKKEAEK